MKNLIHFIVKNSVVFLFILLEILCLFLILNNKGYQRSVFLSSANTVTGWMYEKSSNISGFFKLRESNNNLAEQNAILKNRVTELENRLYAITDSSDNKWKNLEIAPEKEYKYISAKVINNTTQFAQNYLTLNKGSNDGIKPDMGVISNNSVVGIVETVSPHFCKVISILHPITSINVKFKSNNYFGPVVWDGESYQYAKLNDIARHVKFNVGDTLITSGLAKAFPEGIILGTVDKYNLEKSDSYYDIRVKLSIDYHSLTHVKVIKYLNYDEHTQIENSEYGDKIVIKKDK